MSIRLNKSYVLSLVQIFNAPPKFKKGKQFS
ncbi:hypothetical protein BHY_0966 (plasmid) [Borrelia nietonii YOR]|uniref:Uncharacterized protein n=1 Tax=Borrelia nietonii YOR TaxID=1293576 RepID=W5SAD3_9SPIR|nr:hypothetical protein BHY_0966 [Borrelia nietonii YOR]